MPVHKGHLALIDFALSKCDQLIVSMSYTENDPIDGGERYEWLNSIYRNSVQVIVEMVVDDFDNESLPLHERTQIWAKFITKRFPRIDIVFSSEEYGESFARSLGARSVLFDLDRTMVPISASEIRKEPFQHWDFIPSVVRPYFVKKICFYGPESTGKSEMTKRLARHYETEFVPEVARDMISSNDFSLSDIEQIGKAQTESVFQKTKTASKILFCDTDLITTQIYSQHYLNEVPSLLYELEHQIHYDQYFLFDIDVPWIPDGLRDLGDKRQDMFSIFKHELEKRKIEYVLVSGNWEDRFEIIRYKVDNLLR